MRLYKTVLQTGTDSYKVQWDGTQADARAARKDFGIGIGPHGEDIKPETHEIDVPTDKPGLLAWLNANGYLTGE